MMMMMLWLIGRAVAFQPSAPPPKWEEVVRRFDAGQEVLRRNAGLPLLDQQGVLDKFEEEAQVPPELRRLRRGSFMNNAGGTGGKKTNGLTKSCLVNCDEARKDLVEYFFQNSPTARLELLPSTTKSIEATVAVLAREGRTRERPVKVLLPSDAHYAWRNVLRLYDRDDFLRVEHLEVGDLDHLRSTPTETTGTPRIREGDFVVAVYTFANTVTGRGTNGRWMDATLDYCRAKGASTHVFVDAALAGCVSPFRALEERDDAKERGIPGTGALLGLVTSGFKDFLQGGSLLFFDDEHLHCCKRNLAPGHDTLSQAVAGGSHPLISLAPCTSIPESPLLGYLLACAPQYADFRLDDFRRFKAQLKTTLRNHLLDANFQLNSFFPVLHLDLKDRTLAADLYDDLEPTYSLIAIDDEPTVLRIFPTPTNHDFIDAIDKALLRRRLRKPPSS